MKMLFSLVLLSLLFSPVLSLECYVCSSSATNEECNRNTQECQTPLDTCMTVVDTLGSVTAIVKQCASRATCEGASSSASVDSDGNGNKVNCCNTFDLCNFSGAESIHAHMTLLFLTVGALLLLSC
ncbi:ly6/PLAUR domain-containing protein 6B-like [Seriola aureovittata]|uniref:ly6/PLAUR domain-containing protein 6B-like n=1 Tax=Seriola aureovittata TaxID=2871759 RepID=UPI0024BE95AE|nr:ly6/PLAUR domain-containing protein 6B-like [Seriola aureovittata]